MARLVAFECADPDPPLAIYPSSDDSSTDSSVVSSTLRVRSRLEQLEINPFLDDPYGDATGDADLSSPAPAGGGDRDDDGYYSQSRSSERGSSAIAAAAAAPSSPSRRVAGPSPPGASAAVISPVIARMRAGGEREIVRPLSHGCRMIDNTALFYVPLRLRCGSVAMCRPDVLARCPQVLHDLNADLGHCLRVLPPSVHGLVRRTRVWVNTSYRYGPVDEPRSVGHSTAHHHDGWLRWARDKPEKARGIEIYSCFDYRRMRLHWNGAGLILHELCHIIHQLTVPGGLENEHVKRLYGAAKKGGRYDNVLRRDWAGRDVDSDMAYCMVNHKEFFAEMSVTYLAGGYRVLDGAAPVSIEACSPPLMSPAVIEQVKRREEERRQLSLLAEGRTGGGTVPKSVCLRSLSSTCCQNEDSGTGMGGALSDRRQLVRGAFGNGGIGVQLLAWMLPRRVRTLPHCNKFFPFTWGQLSRYDPDLMNGMAALWGMIEDWDDMEDSENCGRLGCLGWKGEPVENGSVWL